MKTLCYSLFIGILLAALPAHAQQLPNNDFEQLNDTIAANWATEQFGGGPSTAYAHSGQRSMAVWNWYYYAKGIAVNGSQVANNWNQVPGAGTAAITKASYLTGYYLYDTLHTDSNEDTALITVTYRKNNGNGYDTVAYGEGYLLPTAVGTQTMRPFQLQINDLQPGINPDTVVVIIQSSLNGFCDASGMGYCLYLYVDKLEFSDSITTGVKEALPTTLQVYPNPAQNTVTVTVPLDNALLNVLDISGKLLQIIRVNRGDNVIDISAQSQGIYLLELRNNDGIVSRERMIKY